MTLLTDPLPELPDAAELEFEPEFELELESDELPDVVLVPDPELVVVVDGVEDDVTVLADDFLASAGSCPDTSTTAISSHAATNSATDPLTMRRRIVLARLSRAFRIAWPRARAASVSLSLMVTSTSLSNHRGSLSVASAPPISRR
ncbi:MAG TPA: hypothetical protein VG057_03335 [Solirubrobacteraceae bacterium]|nr:hypothetical protein [Solirubrobacteraceae bacterium]